MNTQIKACLTLLQNTFTKDLLGVYLYGSSVLGGLQKYSDIDLFVVLNRASTPKEKKQLTQQLLHISGLYMKEGSPPPIELTIVVQSEVRPWHYPPRFDFQYGEWLRTDFERGNLTPWSSQEMPDLAILITQVLLASKTLLGQDAALVLAPVPTQDFFKATQESLSSWLDEVASDTRNVLLTLVRIWCITETYTLLSKPAAADWALERLPSDYKPVIKRAKQICIGETQEEWKDLQKNIAPCAKWIVEKFSERLVALTSKEIEDKRIQL